MSEEPSQAGSPPKDASPVPPSEPDGKADVQRKVEAGTVHLPSLTVAQEQFKNTPAVFAPGEGYGADSLVGNTVAAAESGDPTRNKLVTGQPPKPRIHEVDPKVSMGPWQGPHATSDLEKRLQQQLKAQDEKRDKEWEGKLKARDTEWDGKLNTLRAENQQQHKDMQSAAILRENELERKIDNLKTSIVALNTKIDQLRKEKAELEAQHEQELKQEKDKNAELEAQREQQKEELKQVKDKNAELEEALKKEKSKNAKLERQRQGQKGKFDRDRQAAVQGLKDKIRRLTTERDGFKAERDGYKAERDQLKERLEHLTADSNEEQQDGQQGSPPRYGVLFPHVLTSENGSASAPSVQGTIWLEPRVETPPPSPPSDPQQDGEDNTYDEGSPTAQQPHDDPNNPNPYGRNLT